jgi:diaminopimelate epimerase
MKIPFTKAHGAKNDFLLTWTKEAPGENLPEFARAICDRHTGIGADGWLLIERLAESSDADGAIRLFNSDGSEPEISGNGTRCAAAALIEAGFTGDVVRIRTGAGIKALRLLRRSGLNFSFEMNMGAPEIAAGRFPLQTSHGIMDVTLVDVGNPQCVVPVRNFELDWRAIGAEIENHPHFPNRTNVSFVRSLDDHGIEVRFWERGAGETMSSGTGATGAAFASIHRHTARSPVQVLTPAGPLELRLQDSEMLLTGPAEIIAHGEFYVRE